jgi:hypothetical protein
VLYGVTNTSDTAASAWPTDTTIKAIAQNSTRGRIIDGAATDAHLGQVVAIVGDVNGDRLDDIAIGSHDWNSGQGKVRLVWGKKRAEAANPLYVNTLDASKFVEITGETASSYLGTSIAGGDFNHEHQRPAHRCAFLLHRHRAQLHCVGPQRHMVNHD